MLIPVPQVSMRVTDQHFLFSEKNDMTEEAHRIIKVIKQMETSLDDTHANHDNAVEDRDLRVSYPLTRCLQMLNQKHAMVSKLHKERFEQVKSELPHPTHR